MKINYVTQRGNQNPTNEFNVVEEDPSYAFDGKINYITQRGNQNPTNQFNVVEEDPSSSFDAENNNAISQFDAEFSNAKGKNRKNKKSKGNFERFMAYTPFGLVKQGLENRAKRTPAIDAAKLEQAKSQTIAARQLGKTDPADIAMAKALESSAAAPVETPKSNRALYVGIGITAIVLLIGGFVVYTKLKKK
jgi:hypothetical protein